MSITELITSAKILIDADGNKEAVLLDWPLWEQLLTLLEDLEDAEEMAQARQEDDELIPWEQVVAESRHAYKTGQVKRGTADDLIKEISNE
ncbi:MAG: hypothetical protein KDJ65_01725 [Anaerolineae bacterium]|nr:hypothetical protein [Anaerolineae bacterium]